MPEAKSSPPQPSPQPVPQGIFVRIKGGGMVVVPPSQQSPATYVLLEQEDWFEPEIGFVRRYLEPGMGVLDIGAGYGAYTVAMARLIGPTGKLLAFERRADIAAYLRQTVDGNALPHVTLQQTLPGATADASATTLDGALKAANFGKVDFIRLDAERSALDILAGGTQLFAKQSPLVLFTARLGDDFNTALMKALRYQGYALYRAIGPDTLLVPIGNADHAGDNFRINLFACKADRAAELEAAGLLAMDGAAPEGIVPGSGFSFWRQQLFASAFSLIRATTDLRLVRVLDLYAFWRDQSRPPRQRYFALTEAVDVLQSIVYQGEKPSTANTALLARLSYEHGQRERALDLVERLMANERGSMPDTPFWPVWPRYDDLAPGVDPGTWFAASLIEGFERLRAHSGYFAPQMPFDRLAWLSQTPFACAEMERRRILLASRFGEQKATVPAPLITKPASDNLNPELWAALQGE